MAVCSRCGERFDAASLVERARVRTACGPDPCADEPSGLESLETLRSAVDEGSPPPLDDPADTPEPGARPGSSRGAPRARVSTPRPAGRIPQSPRPTPRPRATRPGYALSTRDSED